MGFLKKIFNRLVLLLAPSSFVIKQRLLQEKYFKSVRVKGNNPKILNDLNLIRSNGLIIGNDIVFEGKATVDATAGILVGDNVTIKKGVDLTTFINKTQYLPIVIGAGNTIESIIAPGTILPNKQKVNGLNDIEGNLVFIVSTGRSGSKAIANLLNQHPDAECYHDAFPHLYTWSCDILYDRKTSVEIKKKLNSLYNSSSFKNVKLIGQSDQKIAPLIPILADLFPKAKFLWLIRKADSFVNSSYPRGWFRNSEFGLENNKDEFFSQEVTPSLFDAIHRTNGYLAKEVKKNDWDKMSAFERNCWYWTYWNRMIEINLEKLPKSRSLKVALEELDTEKNNLLSFLGLPIVNISTLKVNAAKYKKISTKDWTKEMTLIYNIHCRESMDKWYGEKS